MPDLRGAILPDPLVVEPDTPLLVAIAQMSHTNPTRANCAIVVANSQIIGIVTPDDVLRCIAQQITQPQLSQTPTAVTTAGQVATAGQANPDSGNPVPSPPPAWDQSTVADVMTSPVITLIDTDFTAFAIAQNLFHSHAIDYLPVINEQGQILGVITYTSLHNLLHVAPSEATNSPLSTLDRVGSVGIFQTDAAGQCIYVNQRWCQIAGVSMANALGDGWLNSIYPDDRPLVFSTWEAAAQAQQAFQLEYRFQTPSGEITWVYGQAVADRDATGQIIGYVGTITDIGAAKRNEAEQLATQKALQTQRDFNQLIAEITSRFVDLSLPELDAEIDRTLATIGTATGVDTCHLIRFSEAVPGDLSLSGRTLSMTHEWTPPNIPRQLELVQNIPMAAFSWANTQLLQRQIVNVPDVKTLPADAIADQQNWQHFGLTAVLSVPLVQKSTVVGFLGFASFHSTMTWDAATLRLLQVMGQTIINAQERLQTEQQLLVNEERLRLALQAANQGFYDLDLRTGEVVVSPEYALMLGYADPTKFQETNAQWIERLHPDDRATVSTVYQEYIAGIRSEYRVEFRQRTVTGDYKWILSMGKIVAWDEQGQPLRMLGTHTDIDNLKRAEATRLQAKQTSDELNLLEQILDIVLAGYWDWDIPNGTEYLSPGLKQMFGYADDELPNLPETWQNLIFPEDLPGVFECFDRHVASHGQVPFYNEVRYRHKDGSTVWVVCSGKVIEWDAAGNPLRMIGCHIDITERKQVEATLQATSEELEQFFLVTLDLLCISDLNGRFRRLNRAWEETLGYAIAELEGQHFLDFIHPDDLQATLDSINDLSDQKTIQAFVNRYRCKDGSYRYLEWYSRPKGELIYAAARDITERRLVEQQLRSSEAHLKMAQRISQVGSWEFNLPTQTIRWSDEVFRMFGRDPSLGVPSYEELLNLHHPDDREYLDQQVRRTLATGEPYDIECRVCQPTGNLVYIQARGEPRYDAAGKLIQLVGTVIDITTQKRADEALRLNEERMQLALEGSGDGLWDWDISNGEVYLSPRWLEMLGYGLDELSGQIQTWAHLIHPDDETKVMDILQAHLRDRSVPYTFEYRMRHKSGQWRWLANYGKVVACDAAGNPSRMVGIHRDIHDRKMAEEQVRRYAAQLEASNHELEAFAYSVSHDLRAPLRAIDGFSKALLEDYGDRFDSYAQDYFDRIRKNISRMGSLIDDLLRLSRVSRSEVNFTNVNLSELAAEIIADLRASDRDRQVEFVSVSEAIVAADLTLMRVVLTNLLQNAWKFTSHHPTARIEFGRIDPDNDPVYFVRDDGAGFDMAYANMLFGVFQRLHNTHEFPGTGIGLATVQRAIHRQGGRVWAEGAVEQGATIYFTLGSSVS